ncbi:phosphate ABC transporter substrate-binding protein [Marinibactrum halimedae]|uniref:Phosphate ABC transporter substrate-binding protein n=1 Tax=Marinibactrum halimedae TaxID=1444977 RepID=A0AA37WKI3_9GAMM|nr:phosphate ABC transporter substrate-binding protein [Marinibactrum halimedae]MCD9458089.1 phosphate ABC transporter substrate-binding protein [Marinibactrum halimedae]GLS25023.1 hypothetical protein GCM10007877_07370 [Marinibactrum halimedae]
MKTVLKSTLKAALGMTVLCASSAALAAGAVIVHPSNNMDVDQQALESIFLGKVTALENGTVLLPVVPPEGDETRVDFETDLLNKSRQQMKAHWAQLLFTSSGTPPVQLKDRAQVIKMVSENPSLIGYVDVADIDGSVRVLHRF